MRTLDIAWLAGIIEGEGSFMFKESESPMIAIQMSDEDIVQRVAAMWGRKVNGPYERKDGYKTTWRCTVTGKKAVGWMLTLYVFMGERRQAKIRDVIERWKAYVPPKRPNRLPGVPHNKGKRAIPTCEHKERRVVGLGVCGTCYMRQWRADRMSAAAEQGGAN